MFTTITGVKENTGYDVTQETIVMAQSIIEVLIGRIEPDVSGATDKELLGKAVAYQAAYMHDDAAKVFEQINATQIQQFGQMVTFTSDGTAPFIAPLALLACKRLSWMRSRSVQTGKIFDTPRAGSGWRTD